MRLRSGKPYTFVAVVLLLVLATGCARSARLADDEFGHRYRGSAPDGHTTFVITPPDSGISYVYYPAVYDTVHVRRLFDGPDSAAVELLVKGSFPDSCSELDSVDQERTGRVVTVNLRMRKPESTVCASVMRPYRFYLLLNGHFAPGNYTVRVNNGTQTFAIRGSAGA